MRRDLHCWALLACLLSGPPLAAGSQEVSLFEIPVTLDLGPALEKAESLVPSQTGGPQWKERHGVDVRFQAWRGRLATELRGDTLLVSAHVRYRVQGRKELLGKLAVKAGCGVDEPPRQALVGVAIRLGLAPDWTLHPQFKVMPTRFIDRCEVTALDIDVSPLVERAFRERMEQSLRSALAELSPNLSALRGAAEAGWRRLQSPRELSPGLWLAARPVGIGMAPPQGQGRRLYTAIGLGLQPQLSSSQPAAEPLRPLPPLMLFQPGTPSVRFDIALQRPLAELSAALKRSLAGQSIEVRDQRLVVDDLNLSTDGKRLVLRANISGDMAGILDVRGLPELDPETGGVRFADLDFVFDSKDPDAELVLALFYERIRERLQTLADRALETRMQAAIQGLGAELESMLPAGAEVDLSDLALTALRLDLAGDDIGIHGQARGAVRVSLN